MNTRKSRGKPKVKDDTPIKNVLTPDNSSAKKPIFTSCRRLGLGRKKPVNNSPVVSDLKLQNPNIPIPTTTLESCEGPSTSQVTVNSTPIEEIPKSSASRRKKSSHPIKRTIDDVDKTEGNTYTMILSPTNKKPKLKIIDIFNSDSNTQNPPIIYNIDTNSHNISNSHNILPNDDKGQQKVNFQKDTTHKLLKTTTKVSKTKKSNVRGLKSVEKLSDNIKVCESKDVKLMDSIVPVSNEIKPISKRKPRQKKNKVKDDAINKEIIETISNESELIVFNKVHEEETYNVEKQEKNSKRKRKNVRTPKSKKTKLSTSNVKEVIDLNDPYIFISESDEFDNDFRDIPSSYKKKITVKNKKIVESKTKTQKIDLASEKNKKNAKRKGKEDKKVRKNRKNVNETVFISNVDSSWNDNLKTLDKNNEDAYVGSNLNTKESNNTTNQLILHKDDYKQQNKSKNKKKELHKTFLLPTPNSETENILLSTNDIPIVKTKLEKKIDDNELPISKKKSPSRKNSLLKKNDRKSPIKLSPRQLLKDDYKSKMEEDVFSYTEDSCDSSHISTPVYSPIESINQLPEDKEFFIRRCDVEISPNDAIYECHIKNSQSPIRPTATITCNKECTSSFVLSPSPAKLPKLSTPNIEEIVSNDLEIAKELKNSEESGILNNNSKRNTKNHSKTKETNKKLKYIKKQNDFPYITNEAKISVKLGLTKILADHTKDVKSLIDTLDKYKKELTPPKIFPVHNEIIKEDKTILDQPVKEIVLETLPIDEDLGISVHNEVILEEKSSTFVEPVKEITVETLPIAANTFEKDLTSSISVHNEVIIEPVQEILAEDLVEQTGDTYREGLILVESVPDHNDVIIENRIDKPVESNELEPENDVTNLLNEANTFGEELTSSISNKSGTFDELEVDIEDLGKNVPNEANIFVEERTSSNSLSVCNEIIEQAEIDKLEPEKESGNDLRNATKSLDKEMNSFSSFTVITDVISTVSKPDAIEQEKVVDLEEKAFDKGLRPPKRVSLDTNIILADAIEESSIIDDSSILDEANIFNDLSIYDLEQEKVTDENSKKKRKLLNYYPRVLINLDDIPNYLKEFEIRRKKADEKIYRVNKTPTQKRSNRKTTTPSRKRTRQNLEEEKVAEINYDSHIQESTLIITRVESYANKYNNEKDIETLLLTPPSSRSENDSDSNRNDFQIEEPELLLLDNPFGEGTSRQGLTDTTKTTPESNNITNIETFSPEDREVASLSSKSTIRKRDKLKQKRKTPLPVILPVSIDYDSDNDFQTPKSQPKKIPSKSFLIKNDSGVKSIIKNELCDRLEIFRLTENSSMTTIHRGQYIEYAKSTNYDYVKPKPLETTSNKSVIQKHCSYPSNKPITSIFDSVLDDPVNYIRSQEIPNRLDVLEKIKQIELRIKEKQAKIEHLNLINIYKKKHNLENLSKATSQMTKKVQEALLELAVVVRQTSEKPFDMGTLLYNLEIPHDIVGYNMDLDEFT